MQPMWICEEQKSRLNWLGDVTFYDELSNSYDEWVERCQWADVICTGKFGLKQKYQELADVFISLGFVGVGFFDKEILKKNNVMVSNSPGCNKDAVTEWVIFMLLALMRKFPAIVNVEKILNKRPETTTGLKWKSVCILGQWNIWSNVGYVCEAFGMRIFYVERWEDLLESVEDADVVISCFSVNESTKNLLNEEFFAWLKKWAYFITPVDYVTYDVDALISSLDNWHLAGAAIDAMWIQVGDVDDKFYKKIQSHPKILATPHIAWASDVADKRWGDMMIDNVEAWIAGKPINLI